MRTPEQIAEQLKAEAEQAAAAFLDEAIRLAVAEEREACAKVADSATDSPDDGEAGAAANIAAAIRARSES